MKERIVQLMEHERLTPSRFAEEIGIQRAAMSHILAGRNNPSLEVVKRILDRFTYVNPDWLLFGRGEMSVHMPKITPEVQVAPENRTDSGVEPAPITPKPAVVEKVIVQEKPSKTISKIMIFYSDNTFDTFIPEKNRKE